VTLHELIERQARERPARAALILKGHSLSYKELQDHVEKWASVLHQRGVKAGDAYGLVMRNSPEFVITFFALVRLGARAVPVNFMLKADEIAFIFEDAGVVGVITQPPFLKTIHEARKQVPTLRDVVVTGDRREDALNFQQLLEEAGPVENLPRCEDDETVAMIIYTSGTTGKPKGAMLTHRNFVSNVQQCLGIVKLSHKDNFCCLLPMFHSFAWTVCVLVPLYLGCTVVIVESIQPFGAVIKQIMRHRVSIFVAVPPIYAALTQRVPFWRPLKFMNPVRICVSGAAALPAPVHHGFESKFGIPLLEGYGLTEASPVVSLNPEKNRLPGSVGKPLPGIEVKILSESGQALPIDEVGEICIKGANTMKGYYRHDEATRQAFVDPEHQWLRTGDLGYLDGAGFLHISDRKKDLIIVKGFNVYPKEVEDRLLAHAAVQEAAVIGVPDGTGDEIIRGYVILKEGQQADKQELLKWCRDPKAGLAAYKCPRDIEIRKELPKNTLGKILKRQLRVEAMKS